MVPSIRFANPTHYLGISPGRLYINMYNRSEGIPMSSINQVVGLTQHTETSRGLSLGAALHLSGISLEMLTDDETAQYMLLAKLSDTDARRLQWWLDDFRNTGISIL